MPDPHSPLAALREPLQRGAAALGLELAPEQIERLLAYLALLQRWNAVYNLTAVRDPREMVTRHLLDSLAVHPHIDAITLADLGSGAGLPGIPLAIAAPARQVTLVESNGKKARFLREAQRSLALANVAVAEVRAERAEPQALVAGVVARALASLRELVALAEPWLGPHGRLYAMKGPGHEAELAALPPAWSLEAVHRLVVPDLDGDRWLVVLKRSGSGPAP